MLLQQVGANLARLTISKNGEDSANDTADDTNNIVQELYNHKHLLLSKKVQKDMKPIKLMEAHSSLQAMLFCCVERR